MDLALNNLQRLLCHKTKTKSKTLWISGFYFEKKPQQKTKKLKKTQQQIDKKNNIDLTNWPTTNTMF